MSKHERIIAQQRADYNINMVSFQHRAMELVERLDSRCRDKGLKCHLHEMDTWDHAYQSEVYLTMGEAFEIMRLMNFVKEKGLK